MTLYLGLEPRRIGRKQAIVADDEVQHVEVLVGFVDAERDSTLPRVVHPRPVPFEDLEHGIYGQARCRDVIELGITTFLMRRSAKAQLE